MLTAISFWSRGQPKIMSYLFGLYTYTTIFLCVQASASWKIQTAPSYGDTYEIFVLWTTLQYTSNSTHALSDLGDQSEYLILMIITEQSRVGASSVVRLWTLWTVATLNQSPPVHSWELQWATVRDSGRETSSGVYSQQVFTAFIIISLSVLLWLTKYILSTIKENCCQG